MARSNLQLSEHFLVWTLTEVRRSKVLLKRPKSKSIFGLDDLSSNKPLDQNAVEVVWIVSNFKIEIHQKFINYCLQIESVHSVGLRSKPSWIPRRFCLGIDWNFQFETQSWTERHCVCPTQNHWRHSHAKSQKPAKSNEMRWKSMD